MDLSTSHENTKAGERKSWQFFPTFLPLHSLQDFVLLHFYDEKNSRINCGKGEKNREE